jgi:hypothetical protein
MTATTNTVEPNTHGATQIPLSAPADHGYLDDTVAFLAATCMGRASSTSR